MGELPAYYEVRIILKEAVNDLLNLVALHLPKMSMISLYKMKKLYLNLTRTFPMTHTTVALGVTHLSVTGMLLVPIVAIQLLLSF